MSRGSTTPAAAGGLGLLAALLLAGGGFYLLRSRAAAPPPPVPAPAAVPAPTPVPVPPAEAAPAPAEPARAAPAVRRGTIRYPDGSTRPALNGVTEDVTLNWGLQPFTPIVGVITDAHGQQWYQHENGTLSTVWNGEMNGVPQAQGAVAEPTSAAPLHDPKLQQATGGKK